MLPKRTDVLNYLNERNCHIYCLQDTHFILEWMKNLFDLVGIVTVILVLLGQMQGELQFLFAKNLEYKVQQQYK